MTQVVVTGLAVRTSRGSGLEALRMALRAEPMGANNSRTLGAIDVDIDALLRATRTRHAPTMQLLAAVERDLGATLAQWSDAERRRAAITIANTSTGLQPYVEMYTAGSTDGPRAINPAQFPTTMLNYPATQLARAYGLTGPNTTMSSTNGADAIEYATARIAAEGDTKALVGGLEVLPPQAPSDEEGTSPHAEAIAMLMLARGDRVQSPPPLAVLEGWASVAPSTADRSPAAIDAALAAAGRTADSIERVITQAAERLPGFDTAHHCAIDPLFGRCLAASTPVQCTIAVDAVAQGAGPTLVVASDATSGTAAFVFASP